MFPEVNWGLWGGLLVAHTEIWGSFLDYFFINYTLRPDTLARRSPFRSSRQPAELLSEVNSLHRITSPLSKLPCLATPLN